MNFRGKIEEKKATAGTKKDGNPWKRFVFKIGGKTFSTFDSESDQFDVGDEVIVDYNVDGQFNNIKSMRPDDGTEVITEEEVKEITNTPRTGSVQNIITEQWSINAAIQMIAEHNKLVLAGNTLTGTDGAEVELAPLIPGVSQVTTLAKALRAAMENK